MWTLDLPTREILASKRALRVLRVMHVLRHRPATVDDLCAQTLSPRAGVRLRRELAELEAGARPRIDTVICLRGEGDTVWAVRLLVRAVRTRRRAHGHRGPRRRSDPAAHPHPGLALRVGLSPSAR